MRKEEPGVYAGDCPVFCRNDVVEGVRAA